MSFIALDEAKAFLNISSNANDNELQEFIDAATAAWVSRVGPLDGSPVFDEWYDGGGPVIALRHTPVQSVTSITEAYSDTLAYTLVSDPLDGTGSGGAYGYSADLARGIITRRTAGTATSFAPGIRNVHVVYVAGYPANGVPSDIRYAVKALLKQMWETQRGSGNVPGGQPDNYVPVALWPPRAQAVAESYLVPGIA